MHARKAIEVEARPAAKIGGVVKTKLRNLYTKRIWELQFWPQEKVAELAMERRRMEVLYAQGGRFYLYRSGEFCADEMPNRVLGPAASFPRAGHAGVDRRSSRASRSSLPTRSKRGWM